MLDNTRRADALGYLAHQPAHLVAVSVHGVEREGLGVDAQTPPELGERQRIGPAERGRRDIRIAEAHDRDAAPGQGPQELERGGTLLLHIVDEEELESAERCTVDDRSGCFGDQLGRVEIGGGKTVDHGLVVDHEVGSSQPLGPVVSIARRAQVGGAQTGLGDAHHELAQLGAETGEGTHFAVDLLGPARPARDIGSAREQLADDAVLFGTREQPGRGLVAQRGLRLHDAERHRGDGARERAVGRPVDPQGQPVAQPVGRQATGCENEQRARIEAQPVHAVDSELHERRRLAAAGSTDDDGGVAEAQLEHNPLRRVQGRLDV